MTQEHTPTPWAVIYHSHDDVFEVKVVEDKMVADGLAEDADKTTEGNVETLSLPAHKLFEACNAHERLKQERDALRDAAKKEIAKPTMHNKNLHGRPCSMQRSEGGLCECGVLPDLQIALALCEKGEQSK